MTEPTEGWTGRPCARCGATGEHEGDFGREACKGCGGTGEEYGKLDAEPNHAARGHSELGASICYRWWNCPGSVALVRGLPNDSGDAARRGTAAHEVAELCLRSGQDAIEYTGRTIDVDGTPIEVDEKIADGVQVYLDDCRACVAQQVVFKDEMQVEVQFDLSPLDPPAPMFGTADFVVYNPMFKRLYVKDYKNGFLPVSADTPQLKYYALGAMLALGPDKPVAEVEVTIVQPNGLGEAVKRIEYDALDLAEWSMDLIERARATQEPGAPLVPGPWCDKTFCPAAGRCPARAAQALEVAQDEFADGLVPDFNPLPAEMRLLTPQQVGELLHKAAKLEALIKALRDTATALVARGEGEGIGWKLVRGDGRTSWRDENNAVPTLFIDFDMAEDDVFETRPMRSPAQVRDALAAKIRADRGVTKKVAVEEAKAALADLTHTPPAKEARLVLDSDPRPAITGAADEFDAEPAPTI